MIDNDRNSKETDVEDSGSEGARRGVIDLVCGVLDSGQR